MKLHAALSQEEALRLWTASTVLDSAVESMRDIAAMGRKPGSEIAENWLLSHGYALDKDGCVPGKGFRDETAADTGNTEVWACVSRGTSPPYIRFFNSKAELDSYKWKHPDIEPRKVELRDSL